MIDPAERKRLEKLVGMLGSSFDGERANAARMIAALAEKHRLTIAEMMFGGPAPRAPGRSPPKDPPKSRSRSGNPLLTALREIAEQCDEWEFTLTAWECQFAEDVSGRYASDYELSEKQIVIVERILRKVELARKNEDGPA